MIGSLSVAVLKAETLAARAANYSISIFDPGTTGATTGVRTSIPSKILTVRVTTLGLGTVPAIGTSSKFLIVN